MKFHKKRRDYFKEHSKRKAIKELKQDPRIKKIQNRINSLIVETKPITPTTWLDKRFAYGPIGEYTITINFRKRRKISIGRKQKKFIVGRDHTHFMDEEEGQCWGEVCDEIDTIIRNKDWYWTVKYCLELLQDLDDKNYIDSRGIVDSIFLQLQLQDSQSPEQDILRKGKKKMWTYTRLRNRIKKEHDINTEQELLQGYPQRRLPEKE